MRRENARYLVETEWLQGQLEDADLRIFDCTVFVRSGKQGPRLESGYETWEQGHIPGSGFADLVTDLANPNHPLPLMMPSARQFSEAMSQYGVTDGTRVVLYDADRNMWAARVWWMLRTYGFDDAAILNGGWRKWMFEGRPVSTEPSQYARANFFARPRPELIASKDEVLAAVSDGNCCLINALTPAEHEGRRAFYGRPGHIPTSINVPARSIVDKETHAYLPEAELQAMFADAGFHTSGAGRVVTYCGGGVAASSDAFVLTLLGIENVAVYDGSLLEWAFDPRLPMVY